MSQADYCRYYDSQRGGQIPVFRGGLQQSGAGLGDILRGIFRFLMPVALRGIQTFTGNTLAGAQAGMPLAAAAKAAIMPTISAVAGAAAPQVSRFMNKIVPGVAQQSGSGVLFDGENGIPTTAKAIAHYKRMSDIDSDGEFHYTLPAKVRKRSRKRHVDKVIGTHYNF
jgi:hypothetical protein